MADVNPSVAHTKQVSGAALALIERTAEIWQAAHPGEPAIYFIVGAGEFVAQHLAQLSDDAAEAFLQVMRDQRADCRRRRH